MNQLELPVMHWPYLFDDYYVRVVGFARHARGFQVHYQRVGLGPVCSTGLSEFMRTAVRQPRY